MGLLQGFPQFPDETFDTKTYNALTAIHLAINNLDSQYALFTGVDAYPANNWPLLNNTDAYTGWQANKGYFQAGGSITAGHLVTIFDSGASPKVLKAIANDDLNYAQGIANSSGSSGTWIEVLLFEGVTNLIGGMIAGQQYWLSDSVAGAIQNTRPTTSGGVQQGIGRALTSTKLLFSISQSPFLNP